MNELMISKKVEIQMQSAMSVQSTPPISFKFLNMTVW